MAAFEIAKAFEVNLLSAFQQYSVAFFRQAKKLNPRIIFPKKQTDGCKNVESRLISIVVKKKIFINFPTNIFTNIRQNLYVRIMTYFFCIWEDRI